MCVHFLRVCVCLIFEGGRVVRFCVCVCCAVWLRRVGCITRRFSSPSLPPSLCTPLRLFSLRSLPSLVMSSSSMSADVLLRRKLQLYRDIHRLPAGQLGGVIDLLPHSPVVKSVEIDLNLMDLETMARLETYVQRCLMPPPSFSMRPRLVQS